MLKIEYERRLRVEKEEQNLLKINKVKAEIQAEEGWSCVVHAMPTIIRMHMFHHHHHHL